MDKKIWKPFIEFWNFAWHEDSFWSWIVFIGLVFVLIKMIIFPVLSLVTGTVLPLAIVESCSMYHGEGFEDWWGNSGEWYENQGISKEDFGDFYLRRGFTKGDIFFILGVKKENLELGDVIIFDGGKPIIHRVVGLNPLQTKGDNYLTNADSLSVETNIKEEQIIGKATIIKVPLLGWTKLIFYEPFRKEYEKGTCVAQMKRKE
ncbi:MAG: S26 family signal peptidase [Nanoarchaeota archaeon]|nr:S26 family signal peptidase [Nanoarchaeota archaeon]